MEKIQDFIQIYIEMIMMVRMWVMTWYDKDGNNDAYTNNNYVHNDLKIQQ